MKKIEILDTMLRDGMQGEGISYSVEDKVKIALALDRLGIGCIEAGNPGSNPKDKELFRRLQETPLEHSQACAFGSTRRKDISAEEDVNLQSILEVDTSCVTIFGKAYDLHVTEILETTLIENLRMIEETVAFLSKKGKRVIFDAEHFFDGYMENPGYAMEALRAAQNGGADVLCLCDTRGGTYVWDLFRITKQVKAEFPDVKIGIHCHNDCGLAVAGTMAAVEAGAEHIQGTLLGIGERCGNCLLYTSRCV